MPSIVTSNNSNVLVELGSPAFLRLGLEVHVARDAAEALALIERHRPGAALLDLRLPDASGGELCLRIKERADLASTRVVLLVEGSITAALIEELSRSRCDEVLVAPLTGDTLFYKVTQLMGLPRRVRRRMAVLLHADVSAEKLVAAGRVVDLSPDGARLSLEREARKGQRVLVRIGGGEGPIAEARAEVVWSSREEDEGGWSCGVRFLEPDLAARTALMDLSLWDVFPEPDGTTVVSFQGDFREHTDFSRLCARLKGQVVFDMAWVRYLNSSGVRHWVSFLRALQGVTSYSFVRCSIAFVTQASMVPEVMGRGVMESFMVPFACRECELEEERLVQTSTFALQDTWPPSVPELICPRCRGELVFDDVPARYFAFLKNDAPTRAPG